MQVKRRHLPCYYFELVSERGNEVDILCSTVGAGASRKRICTLHIVWTVYC